MYKKYTPSVAAKFICPALHVAEALEGAESSQKITESVVSTKPVLKSSGLISPDTLSGSKEFMTLLIKSVLVL
jgi:hypothetical protein|tara:strand:- start:287 stop:505 length:219 start_codon:yes stop_codon:yes gene_type:complete